MPISMSRAPSSVSSDTDLVSPAKEAHTGGTNPFQLEPEPQTHFNSVCVA